MEHRSIWRASHSFLKSLVYAYQSIDKDDNSGIFTPKNVLGKEYMNEKVKVVFSGSINAEFEIEAKVASKLLVFITSPEDTTIGTADSGTAVKGKFSGRKRNYRRSNTGVNSVKSIRDEVRSLDLVPEMEGYPKFHGLSKADQILWLLIFSQKHGIDSLFSTEITFLANRLSIRISASHLSGLTETSRNKGRIYKNSDGSLKVYNPGIDYLKITEDGLASRD